MTSNRQGRALCHCAPVCIPVCCRALSYLHQQSADCARARRCLCLRLPATRAVKSQFHVASRCSVQPPSNSNNSAAYPQPSLGPHVPLDRHPTCPSPALRPPKKRPGPSTMNTPPPTHTRPHSTPASSAGTVDMDAHQATQACCRCCCCSCYSGHSPSPLLAAAFTRIAPTGHNTLHAQDAAAAVHPSEPIHQTQTPPCCCCCLTQ